MFKPSPKTEYDPLFERFGKQFNLPKGLLKAIADQESAFNPNAFNKRDQVSTGLMQINKKLALSSPVLKPYWSGRVEDLYDPEVSVVLACVILKEHRDNGLEWDDTISKYNRYRNRDRDGNIINKRYLASVMGLWMFHAGFAIFIYEFTTG